MAVMSKQHDRRSRERSLRTRPLGLDLKSEPGSVDDRLWSVIVDYWTLANGDGPLDGLVHRQSPFISQRWHYGEGFDAMRNDLSKGCASYSKIEVWYLRRIELTLLTFKAHVITSVATTFMKLPNLSAFWSLTQIGLQTPRWRTKWRPWNTIMGCNSVTY